ncbi:acyltransferase family protein [Nakamurella aerolata]|uniref:Acyltransferase family protein n=1 Tax=Nakamurella aerolata TaxID=1656892 RepID=A0A849A4U4_9ACTN|nr:acyltransferase [Nakamurella aerolata]NNG35565.1 acyltransferase family protein [Nakamurella aerolata]
MKADGDAAAARSGDVAATARPPHPVQPLQPASSSHPVPAQPVPPRARPERRSAPRTQRDPYADFLRAFSLLVVILWHWCFTILIWTDDGPYATSPLGFTSGLWIFTWLLQVMPIFFYIGGYVHLQAWQRAAARGDSVWVFVLRQIKALGIPAAALLGVWIVIGIVLVSVFDISWTWKAVTMVVSPLWFIAAYMLLIALMPLSVWLNRRYGNLVLVVLAGLAVIVDILRFRYQIPYVPFLNMIFVWGFAFQLGYFHTQITGLNDAPRYSDGRIDWQYQSPRSLHTGRLMALAGLFALIGLVFSGLYPGSMVGVPGEASNMAPPTVCIIALTFLQVGVAEIVRPAVLRGLAHGKTFAKATALFTRFAMPLFLFHTTGMALARAIEWTIFGREEQGVAPTTTWWLLRPVEIIFPLICTLPVIYLFGRRWQNQPVKVEPRQVVDDPEVGDGGDQPVRA